MICLVNTNNVAVIKKKPKKLKYQKQKLTKMINSVGLTV